MLDQRPATGVKQCNFVRQTTQPNYTKRRVNGKPGFRKGTSSTLNPMPAGSSGQ